MPSPSTRSTEDPCRRRRGRAPRRPAPRGSGPPSWRRSTLQAVYLGDRLGPVSRPRRRRAGDGARTGRPRRDRRRATPASGSSTRPSARSSTSTTWTPPPDERRYSLPAGHEEVLARPGQPLPPGAARPVRRRDGRARCPAPRTRTGPAAASTGPTTAPTSSRPRRASTGRSSMHLVGDWIDALPDIADAPARRRRAGSRTSPVARAGHRSRSPASSRAIQVDGIDIDAGSIARAKAHAAAEGLTDRVSFLFADAADSRRRRPLRPRHDLRGRPRHGPAGRGARARLGASSRRVARS